MQIIKAFLVSMLFGFSCSSNAALIWDWQFEDDNLGTINPHSLLQAKAVLTNDIASTESINGSYLEGPRPVGTGLYPVMLNGNFSFTNDVGFGAAEPFPWGNFTSYFYSINLDPGSSLIFDFAWVSSLLPSGFAPGHYTMDASISVCESDCLNSQSTVTKVRTLHWNVSDTATVPEPSPFILLFIGLVFLGLRSKRSTD